MPRGVRGKCYVCEGYGVICKQCCYPYLSDKCICYKPETQYCKKCKSTGKITYRYFEMFWIPNNNGREQSRKIKWRRP